MNMDEGGQPMAAAPRRSGSCSLRNELLLTFRLRRGGFPALPPLPKEPPPRAGAEPPQAGPAPGNSPQSHGGAPSPRVSPATTPQLPLCRLGDPLAPLLRAELPPAGSGPSAQQPHGRRGAISGSLPRSHRATVSLAPSTHAARTDVASNQQVSSTLFYFKSEHVGSASTSAQDRGKGAGEHREQQQE